MDPKIITLAPQAQCCIGFESDFEQLDKVCHHCGRALCVNHTSTPILAERQAPNPEFRYLAVLGEEQPVAVHCPECATHPPGWSNLGRKFFRIVGLLLGSDWIQKHWYLGKLRPPVPLTPDVIGINLEEKIDGSITLDAEGVYKAVPEVPTGELKVNFRLMPRDRATWTAYSQRYGVRVPDETTRFHAGFALLKAAGNIAAVDLMPDAHFAQTGVVEFTGLLNQVEFFNPPAATLAPKVDQSAAPVGTDPLAAGEPTVLPSPEPVTATAIIPLAAPDQPAPPPPTARSASTATQAAPKNSWPGRFKYNIVRSNKKAVPLPLRLIPTIGAGERGCSLTLALQLNLETGTSPDLATMRIEELTIEAPAAVSTVVAAAPFATVSKFPDNGKAATKVAITWQGGLELSKEQPQTRVQVCYARPLTKAMSVTGKVKISGNGTLSGLKSVKLFYPWGQLRSAQPNLTRKTTISINFDLSLHNVRFQETQVKTHEAVYPGPVLDTPLIEKLTTNLDAAQLYVKRVVENPGHPSKTNVQVLQRFWDIAGRSYSTAYAVDFHLALTGEHLVLPGSSSDLGFVASPGSDPVTAARSPKNRIKVNMTVQGVSTNPEMEQRVQAVFDDLRNIVEQTLR